MSERQQKFEEIVRAVAKETGMSRIGISERTLVSYTVIQQFCASGFPWQKGQTIGDALDKFHFADEHGQTAIH